MRGISRIIYKVLSFEYCRITFCSNASGTLGEQYWDLSLGAYVGSMRSSAARTDSSPLGGSGLRVTTFRKLQTLNLNWPQNPTKNYNLWLLLGFKAYFCLMEAPKESPLKPFDSQPLRLARLQDAWAVGNLARFMV